MARKKIMWNKQSKGGIRERKDEQPNYKNKQLRKCAQHNFFKKNGRERKGDHDIIIFYLNDKIYCIGLGADLENFL